MQLSIAFDHRICDGGEAAGVLRVRGGLRRETLFAHDKCIGLPPGSHGTGEEGPVSVTVDPSLLE